ncbi:MAG: hypothetical protein JWQ88_2236 [Rhodoferax sp.]|nr:hypothetical protein [Rhodoferax sp.]
MTMTLIRSGRIITPIDDHRPGRGLCQVRGKVEGY